MKPATRCTTLVALALLAACAHSPMPSQPSVLARVKPILTIDGLQFKDSNGTGKLDAYEDWRRPIEARVGRPGGADDAARKRPA